MTGSTRRELLVLGQRRGAGPRRLAADVDDVGPLARPSRSRVRDGAVDVEVEPAVSERIGRDVEDAHDQRALAELQRRPPGSGTV